ncbi:MAG: membrane protein insertion efficiency factor YidD [Actinobacteria bacterium]|nr:membrane protein insertion efficiency factor YidD [Actinomycetota bacterium]
MKRIPILLISFYQKLISPLFPQRCKYYPSCSNYALEAFREWGFFRGFLMSSWRLLRCNPLSHGGFDPVRKKLN